MRKNREEFRKEIISEIGNSRQYNTLMSKLRKDVLRRKSELKKKYRAKIIHLEKEREKEFEEKSLEKEAPKEFSDFVSCKVFDKGKLKEMKPKIQETFVIGNVKLDTDEKAVLKLNPKFAVMSRLIDEEIERDIEVGLAKMRLELKRLREKELENQVEIEIPEGKKLKLSGENNEKEKEEEKIEKEELLEDAKSRQIFGPVRKNFRLQ